MRNLLLLQVLIFCLPAGIVAQAHLLSKASGYLPVFYLSNNYGDVLSSMANPAAQGMLSQSSIGLYGEKRFLLRELNFFQASGMLQTNSGGIGGHVEYFGAALFNQLQATLSYGRLITEGFAVGGGFHFHQVNQSGPYGKANAITGSFGLMAALPGNMRLGISAYNPMRSKWGKSEDRIPAHYSLGLGGDIGRNLFLGASVVKEEGHPLDVQIAMHYQFLDNFFMRGGIATHSANYFAALGWKLTAFRFDLASGYHPQLGWTPGVALVYNFQSKPSSP